MTTTTEALPSSSVHPLETIGEQLQVTQGQVKLFGRDLQDRETILVAFGLSEEPRLIKRASNIAFCCRSPLIYACSKGRPVLSLQTCKDRMCPRCQRARGQQVTRKVSALINGYNAPRFLTLTLKHRGAESLREMLDRLAHAFRTLRASPFWKRNVTRGVYTVEVTWNAAKREWHAHLHAIIDGEFMAQKELKKLWHAITLDSTIVHIEAVHDRARQAKYISAYVAKPCDGGKWENEQLCEFALATHGRRMVHTFGKSHGRSVEAAEEAQKSTISSCVCSVRALLREGARGCPIACEALGMFKKLGRRWCLSIGMEPAPIEESGPPLSLEEEQRFVFLCQQVAASIEARENPQPIPPPPPTLPKPRLKSDQLFHATHEHRRSVEDTLEIPV